MVRPMIKMLTFLAILFGLIFGYKFAKALFAPRPVQPPISVSATHVTHQDWQPKLQAIGTLRAIQGVDITTEQAGLVTKIYLKSGSQVRTGDILVQLNADAETALRNSLQAEVELAEITYKRDKAQLAIHAISQSVLDTDKADLKNKQAQLAQQEAILAKKTIRAPFTGMLGILAINLGQYLNAGDKVISLQALNPIYIDFSLPQQTLSQVKIGQKIILTTDAYPKQKFKGTITSIEPKIDLATRNIQVEATIANPEFKLYPGMFAEVDIYTSGAQRYLTLPKTAISFNPFGEIVYMITQTGKDKSGKPILSANQTFVIVGESRGDQIAVLQGLKEGDYVVTTGQLKLKNGALVAVNNSVLPTTDPTPQLVDE